MPATLRERIADDVMALIAAGSPPAAPERSRTYAFGPEAVNSVTVYWTEDRIEAVGVMNFQASLVTRELDLVVEVRTKGTSSSRPDEEADVYASWVEKKLAGQSKGVTAGSLYYVLVVRGVSMELDQADHARALAKIFVTAKYQSRANDPETWA